MAHFLRLVQNENTKIYKRSGTWMMIAVLVLVIALVGAFSKYILDSSDDANWKEHLRQENIQLTESLKSTPMFEVQKKGISEKIVLNEYRIANDLKPLQRNSLWGYMVDAANFTGVATMFTIVIAAGMVAGEFSWGTIKLLLIRPASRTKVLVSKYISTLLFGALTLLLLFVSSFFFGIIFFGFNGVETPFITFTGENVIEQNMVTYILSLYGFRSIDMIMMVTLAFMISTVFRSSSLAIGISLFLMFTGPQLVQLLSKYSWVKYILFANTNLQQYTSGNPLTEGMTMSFSVMMLIVYFTLFSILSLYIFNKRDVAA